ncbi:MAG: hypothetical protein EDX89_22370 [Acidobacteria bacterium]|nr:MAG: hypothetical protein EDX89_22370 [Acidobacteriota bacterium]MCE7958722.1 hypothetical protein [Acidobacteria bacterium ACB2]
MVEGARRHARRAARRALRRGAGLLGFSRRHESGGEEGEEREGAPQEALLGSAPGVAGRKLSTVSTIRSQEKAPRASRIAADIASPRPSRKKSTTARASAAGSDGGTRIPVSPSWTASGSPPTRVATTGFPKP